MRLILSYIGEKRGLLYFPTTHFKDLYFEICKMHSLIEKIVAMHQESVVATNFKFAKAGATSHGVYAPIP